MGLAADVLAEKSGVSRERQDAYAARSHALAAATRDAGGFDAEVVPVGDVRRDERPRTGLTVERLARLRPAFRPAADGGTVTAGNSCGVNDGAAAVTVVDADTHRRLGVPGLRVLATATAGVDPNLPGLGLVPAAEQALDLAGLRVGDLDVVELNEAFAGQVLACCDALSLDPSRVCVEGGALALGHPWGASGCGARRPALLAARPGLPRALRARGDRGRWRPGRRDGGRAMPVIEARGVTHRYGEHAGARTVLADVDLRISEPRVGVVGANGSGKSTFARMVNGLVLPTAGTVSVDGLDTRTQGREVRRRVGFCFTDPDAQIVMPTVAEDVAFGLRRRGLSKPEIRARVDAALASYGLDGHADHPAHLLSGGQKQLLALASVLVTEPDVLVMDEPTTLLDLRNATMISRVVAELPQQVLLVTHHLDLLDGFDRVLVFDGGRVVCDDSPASAVTFYRKLMA